MENNTDSYGWPSLISGSLSMAHPISNKVLKTHAMDWLIIGGGFTAMAFAHRLCELNPSLSITMIDARQIGQAASGKNAGFAMASSQFGGAFDPDKKAEYERVNKISEAGQQVLKQRVDQYNIDCQWHEAGSYYLAKETGAIQEAHYYSDYLNQLQLDHKVVEEYDLSKCLGTNYYHSGVYIPSTVLMQPSALVRGLAVSLPQQVELYENTKAITLSADKCIRVDCLNSEGETIELKPKQVLVATNYESNLLGLNKNRYIPMTLSGSITRVLSASEQRSLGDIESWGGLSLHSGGATVRYTQDKRLMIRNTAEYKAGQLLSDEQLQQRTMTHRAAFIKRFPELSKVEFETSWSGVEGVSVNAANIFSQPYKNVYSCGCYNGSGVSRGTSFGHALADKVNGRSSELLSLIERGDAPKWVPPRPFLDVGAAWKVHQRFKSVAGDQ